MPTLYFPEKHKQLVDDLCSTPVVEGGNPIFSTYRELMLFSAMVGKHTNAKKDRVGNGGEVESNYFASTNFSKEGVIYLMGLLDFQDPEKLKDGAKDCWKQFENYCAGGLDIISGWLEGVSDIEEYPEVLEEKILQVARQSHKVNITVRKPKNIRV